MKTNTLVTSSLILGALVLGTNARAAETPSVDSVLAKYESALGGKAATEKITSRMLKIQLQSDTISASDGEIYAKPPNKQCSKIELANMGTITEGFDGTVAWAKTPWEDLRVKAGDELAKVKRDAVFNREMKLKTIYPDLAYKTTEKVDGEDVYVLEAKPTSSSKEKLSFSAKTGLLVRQDSEFEGPQGIVKVTSLPQDYQPEGGLKYPRLIKVKFSAGDQAFEFTMKVLEVKHNVTIDDAKFTKPSA